MSRETIVGLIAALKLYLGHDEEAVFDGWMKTAEWMRDQLKGIPGVQVGITYQRAVEDGEPMAPFTYLRLNKEITGIDGVELAEVLKKGDPPIYAIFEPWFMMEDCENMVTLNPEYMLDGEAEIVIEKVTEILSKFKK